ncbi:hypothetical protein JCM16138_15860 [Thermococcus atlanticus]
MPSSTTDLSVNVAKKLYIDRYGISTLTDFNTLLYARFRNQSPQLVYIRAVIEDANGNWTFDDGTTTEDLGSVPEFGTTDKYMTLKRSVPTADVEESFRVKFEFYKDASYTQKIDEITENIEANIIDFRNSTEWATDLADFEDGTEQGWTLNLFNITQDASIEAGGYSAYYLLNNTKETVHPSIKKTISIPSTAAKAGLLFYWGASLSDTYGKTTVKMEYVRVYINGKKVYEDYVNKAVAHDHPGVPNHARLGWYQASIDLTPWKGQNVEVKIEFEMWIDWIHSGIYIASAIDDVMIVSK